MNSSASTLCKQCSKEFFPKLSQVKVGKGLFCCRRCYGDWQMTNGKRFHLAAYMAAHPEKVEQANKKKLGLPAWNKNTRLNYKTVGFLPGDGAAEKHSNWKGGSWSYWQRFVHARDKGTCKHCGLYDPQVMQVDHIIPARNFSRYKKLSVDLVPDEAKGILYNPDNMQLLCANCHCRKSSQENKKFGRPTGHLKPR